MNILWDNILKAKTLVKIATLSTRKVDSCYKYGLLTAIPLAGSFVAINNLNFENTMFVFLMLYLLFLAAGVYYTLWKLSPDGRANSVDYFKGLEAGFFTSAIAVLLNSAFVVTYASFNSDFLKITSFSNFLNPVFNPFTTGISLMYIGLAFGVTITFSLMQYFKKDENV